MTTRPRKPAPGTPAPGKVVYRVTGVAVDSSGWVAESPPVYVCLAGNNVGPCA